MAMELSLLFKILNPTAKLTQKERKILFEGTSPPRLHRDNLPKRNPNFSPDPSAYMPTDKSLVEVLLG